MEYLIILGRNPELSLEELRAVCRRESITIHSLVRESNVAYFAIDKKLEDAVIDSLGGTIAWGEVIASGKISAVEKKLESISLYDGVESNITFMLTGAEKSETKDAMRDYFKQRFRSEKLRASEKHGRETIQMQDEADVPSLRAVDCAFVLYEQEDTLYVAKLSVFDDPKKTEARDMQKPIRRESLAIAPRLAKILINLSEVRAGEALMDPFCGIGVILSEATRQKIRVIGIDKDARAIQGAKQNLKWAQIPEARYRLIVGDSTKVAMPFANGLATEPHLGETLRKIPTPTIAQKMILDYEKLLFEVLKNAKKKVSGNIVVTGPYIRTMKSRMSPNFEHIAERIGLKCAYEKPFFEYREGQIVGRAIMVFEK